MIGKIRRIEFGLFQLNEEKKVPPGEDEIVTQHEPRQKTIALVSIVAQLLYI